ncbi:NAD(P)H-dependent flavin oxidoreductase [Neobacillus jeddahensis]|uniref:NAD(P)H-dependent flavin oxidoreductase n=1 Tax=Neobacillus jeddahensis TaxID=1461580 RepID=UPI00058F4C0F|nr:nitronate monooxygenase [Neobacillus jeddahensis]
MLRNELTEFLHIEYPIVQAPMAGGVTTAELVAQVSNSGCLGMVGAGYMTPIQIREQIREIKRLTSNNFGINLFVPNEFNVTENEMELANQILQPFRDQLNVQPNEPLKIPHSNDAYETLKEQIMVVIEEKVPVCSFTFGVPTKEIIALLKKHNIILIGTATTVQEAVAIEEKGMDLVVVQGSEAGGHRGNFIGGFQESLVGLMSLIPQVVDHVSIPVIAAGGIMDGRGLMASICLGAKGVQMGTAFLTCTESGAPRVYKEAICKTTEDETIFTRAFSGKWARGIKNKFMLDMQKHETSLPDFPIQNTLTQSIRRAATSQKNLDYMSLWSGQSPRLAKNQTVETLIKNILSEAKKIIRNFKN